MVLSAAEADGHRRPAVGDDSPSAKAKRKRRVSADGATAKDPSPGPWPDGGGGDRFAASSFLAAVAEPGAVVLGPLPSFFGADSERLPQVLGGGYAMPAPRDVVARSIGTADAARRTAEGRSDDRPGEVGPSAARDYDRQQQAIALRQYAQAQRLLPSPHPHCQPPLMPPPPPPCRFPPPRLRDVVAANPAGHSPDSVREVSRPRKLSRGPSLSGDVIRVAAEGGGDARADAMRREREEQERAKRGLIEKLRTYGTSSEEDFDDDDDEGDVSGEDVFSEDELDGGRRDAAALRPPPFAKPQPNAPFGRDPSPKMAVEPDRARQVPIGGLSLGGASQESLFGGTGGYTPSVATAQSRCSHVSFKSATERKIRELQATAFSYQCDSSGSKDNADSMLDIFVKTNSNLHYQYSGKPSPQDSKSVDAARSDIYEQHNGKPPPSTSRGGSSHGRTSPDRPVAAPNPSGNSFHSKTSRQPMGVPTDKEVASDRSRRLTKKEEKARGIFANLEAQIMQNEGLYHPGEILPSSLSLPDRAAAGAPFYGAGGTGPGGGVDPNEVSMGAPAPLALATSHESRSSSLVAGSVQHRRKTTVAGRSPSARNTKAWGGAAVADGGVHQPRNVIANMEAVLRSETHASEVAASRPAPSGSFQRRLSSSHAPTRAREAALGRPACGPSREVIASIEADMMRLEEEEESRIRQAEMDEEGGRRGGRWYGHHPHRPSTRGDDRAPSRHHHPQAVAVDPYGRRHLPPPGVDDQDLLSIVMMQQQHDRGQHPLAAAGLPSGGNRTLADQISNMAIVDPLHLVADDCSLKSVESFASYDGKCANVFASRVQTQEQELACHALNDAICDLYGAPVGEILRRCPIVTRLVRADDETGNVPLHFAVRNGNVKAIRRIVRADPGCALVRNIQGYCPLHFAVQIGNFAAVQLLCSLTPASAEVQCEEGCLPLHEAVSSAAHLPDAPQIAAALLNAFPSAIKITNDEGLLPLHLAAMSGFSAGIRTIFAYGFSTIYARENTEQMLPLDFAIDGYITAAEEADQTLSRKRSPTEQSSNDADLSDSEMEFRHCIDIFLMSALYDRPVFTPAARNDLRGMTFLPIHGAAASQPCSQSWKQIVSMYGADYASDVDVRGRTALHVLVTSAPWYLEVVTEMIQSINELDPTSATTFDDSGLLPLHAALINHAPYHVVKHLLLCSWSTVSIEVDEDCDSIELRGMLPFQLAAASGCGIDVIDLLLRAHPIGISGALPEDRR